MRVLLAHALTPKRRRIARVLRGAGHEVLEADTPDEALEHVRVSAPDVALIHVECCGDLVPAIKSDPVAFGIAIVMIERPGLEPARALEGMRSGVQDYLVEPVSDGEVLTRVEAAARTKALQQELVAQGARLEALLREDGLTGLSNRRAILTHLNGMVSAARRHGHPLSIAICDLDHFKRINDGHGHKTGDAVLVAAAHAMGTHLRAEDQLGRLGGEEFLVLLPDTNAQAAQHVAEKLRAELAGAATPVPVTVSIGVATWDGEAPEDLLHRADEALYAAKSAGRDRVMAATLHGRT
ncbi:GGDEF domain-containing response regulator [Solirubrobacter soli]|uniref:GGDEF domain-containing response regulator n=1 Tax=Solirubrobacter soli TaxID=363832 RepID=UPI000421988B|nr:diguanylate cyclase [Solirubrobacter soli]